MSSQTSKRYDFSKYLSFSSNVELTDWLHKLEKTLVFLNLCIVYIDKKTHFCVKKKKNEKISYCKNKKHVFWRKNAISFFCITHKMKSVYFSKIMMSLMLLWKQQKNMKKWRTKRCFKSIKQNFFVHLSIDIFFQKKSLGRLIFFFFCSKNAHQLCNEMKKVIFLDNAVAPPEIPTFLNWFIPVYWF